MKKALAYQDVLLVPQYSEVMSRSDVNLSVNLNGWEFNNPIIIANMRDLVNNTVLDKIIESKSLGYMHRFSNINTQINTLNCLHKKKPEAFNYVGVSLGIKTEDFNNAKLFFNMGVRHYVVDVAHGDHKAVIDFISKIKSTFGNSILLTAGNVATGRAAKRLWNAGADVVKLNVGSGSICSTRIETGNGVPTMTVIMDVAEAKKECILNNPKRNYYSIADGGIRSSGDIVKALCFSDMVMIGNLFAGSVDTPGKIININGQDMKEYHGSSTHKSKHVEGYKGLMHIKPSFDLILDEMCQGIRSGCSYQGVNNLVDLKDCPEFIEISNASIIESGAHDIKL